jgi:hypothetical protein
MCSSTLKLAVLIICFFAINGQSNFNASDDRRHLASRDDSRATKLSKILAKIEKSSAPAFFVPAPGSIPHDPQAAHVILTVGMNKKYTGRQATSFCGSARNAKFDGDIVVAGVSDTDPSFFESLAQYKAVTYKIDLNCDKDGANRKCTFNEDSKKLLPLDMLRFYFYQWWSFQYPQSAIIMIADFRDVFFQSNPFTYKISENPSNQINGNTPDFFISFQEFHPNKVIGRCPFNSGWVESCYGKYALQRVADKTVICSGISIATRDAMVVYVSV